MKRRALSFLLVASLVAALGYQLRAGMQAAKWDTVEPAALALELLEDETGPAPRDAVAIERRPLFHASRSYYVPPTPEAAPAIPPYPDYRLVGVLRVPDRPRVATLAHAETRAVVRVRQGDTLEAWTIQTVESDRVVLQFEGVEHEITATRSNSSSGLRVVAAGTRNHDPQSVRTLTVASPVANDKPRLYRPPPRDP